MKSIYAQIATLTLSVAGALAIFVGAIDPQIVASLSGSPTVPLAIAASTPAVSPMA